MYAAVRGAGGAPAACAAFRGERDELFAEHPASPLPAAERAGFGGRALLPPPARPARGGDARSRPRGGRAGHPDEHGRADPFTRIGFVRPTLAGAAVSLAVYWLEGYGGGLFLPFRDALAGEETYGGGRYLLDTVKGADLGTGGRRPPRARLQLRLQPVVRLRPALELPPRPSENRMRSPWRPGERMAPGTERRPLARPIGGCSRHTRGGTHDQQGEDAPPRDDLAVIALLVALGGVGYAAATIGTRSSRTTPSRRRSRTAQSPSAS